jgi:hypothetical protein
MKIDRVSFLIDPACRTLSSDRCIARFRDLLAGALIEPVNLAPSTS